MKYKLKEFSLEDIKACLTKLPVLRYLGDVQYVYTKGLDNPPIWIKEVEKDITFVPTDVEFHNSFMIPIGIPKINGFWDGIPKQLFLHLQKTKEFFWQRKGKASRKTEVIFIDTNMQCWQVIAFLEDERIDPDSNI